MPSKPPHANGLQILVPAALLGFVIGCAALLLSRDRIAVLDSVIVTQANMAESLERDIVRNFDICDLSLRAAAAGVLLVDDTQDRAVQQAILFDGATTARYFRPIVVADETGTVRHDGGSLTPRFSSVAGREYFPMHRAQDGLGLVSLYIPWNVTLRGPYLSLSRRITKRDGQFGGVVAGGIGLDYFQDLFSRFQIPEGGVIAIAGYDGKVIARVPNVDGGSGRELSRGGGLDHARTIGNGSFQTVSSLDGVARMVTVRRLGQTPFFLLVGTPTTTIYADWWMRTWLVAGIVLAFVAASVLLLVALRRELTRRWAAEQAALAAKDAAADGEQRLQTYMAHLADGILAVVRRPDGQFVYERVNAAAARMMQIRPEDIIGRRPHEVWSPVLAEFVEAQWQQAAGSDEPLHYERVLDSPDGRRVLRVILSPVWETGEDGTRQVGLLLASVRDVTETVALETQLRQAQRMEAVGQLTAGVAHDFNNMLQIQFGALELLQDEVADRPDASDYVDMVLAASRHGSKLTHSLLAFARQQHLAPQAIDVQALLKGLRGMLAPTLGPRMEVDIHHAQGVASPFVDAVQLEAALLNLALNARDAMPKGGRLSISASDGRACDSAPERLDRDGHFLIAVTDDGEGMPPDIAAKACEPFFTTKPVGQGSGLGLSMVQGFVQQSGGTMRIVSAPGKGTRVELWLPRTVLALAVVEPAADKPVASGGQGWRILLVDDAPDVLAITAEVLEAAGFEVVQARHGEEALSLLASERPFDALVTDYMMPGLDGGEVVRQALETWPWLPALVVTGYAEFDGLRDLPSHVKTVRKPISGTELAEQIRNAIVRDRHPAEPVALASLP